MYSSKDINKEVNIRICLVNQFTVMKYIVMIKSFQLWEVLFH